MRSVERVAGKREVQVVRNGEMRKDAELTRAVADLGYTAKVIPTKVTSFELRGLACDGCLEKARATLAGLDGVRVSDVSGSTNMARVQYETGATSRTKIRTALRKAGFPPRS